MLITIFAEPLYLRYRRYYKSLQVRYCLLGTVSYRYLLPRYLRYDHKGAYPCMNTPQYYGLLQRLCYDPIVTYTESSPQVLVGTTSTSLRA